MTDLPAHSRVGASGMSRWERDHCPGSVRLSKGLHSKAGYAAAEGTVAHGIAEMALNGELFRKQLGTVVQQDGFDVPVHRAMLDFVHEYKVIVDELSTPDTIRHVEVRFHLEEPIFMLSPVLDENGDQVLDENGNPLFVSPLYGTADCVLWDPVRRHLDVVDFKYGAGHAVEADNNVQLQYYAVGAVSVLGYSPRTIDLHIVQPRCPHSQGPHRTAAMDPLGLLDFAAYLVASVRETEKPDAAIRAGDWCRYCPAAGVPGKCPAQAQAANELAKVAFAPALPYDPAELTRWLDRLPVLEAQIKAVREFAYNEAEAGRAPPQYKLVEKMGREKWRPDTDPKKLQKKFGLLAVDMYEEPELKSPAQIRKLVPGKNDKERAAALAAFTVKESSGHTLVHEDDKRPAIGHSAQQVFAAP